MNDEMTYALNRILSLLEKMSDITESLIKLIRSLEERVNSVEVEMRSLKGIVKEDRIKSIFEKFEKSEKMIKELENKFSKPSAPEIPTPIQFIQEESKGLEEPKFGQEIRVKRNLLNELKKDV
jgi:anion-transporting  ArsA/GET3 family ATPase